MFQFNPTIYRSFDWIKENRETEQWLTRQHAREIHRKEVAAIWASGYRAGFYAVGEIETNPSKKPLNPEQKKYWMRSADVYKFREKSSVIVKYFKVAIDRPLLVDKCIEDPTLSAMEILEQPQGTNFSLTKEQWNRILELIDKKAPNG